MVYSYCYYYYLWDVEKVNVMCTVITTEPYWIIQYTLSSQERVFTVTSICLVDSQSSLSCMLTSSRAIIYPPVVHFSIFQFFIAFDTYSYSFISFIYFTKI